MEIEKLLDKLVPSNRGKKQSMDLLTLSRFTANIEREISPIERPDTRQKAGVRQGEE